MTEAIAYTLRFPAPETHYVEVEARVPTGGRPSIELMMAVWTPGSYLLREFARHVEAVSARAPDGAALAVEKTRKNRWRVATGGHACLALRYRIYARELSVRTNFVDGGFAMLNGAPTFLTLAGEGEKDRRRPHEVRLALPPAWGTSVSALAPAETGAAHCYLAPDYATLVDSPIYAGNPAVHRFAVAGREHLLVNEGEDGIWDGPRSAADLARLVREQAAFWGVLPYRRYVLFNLITEGGGGLEHGSSAVLMTSRWRSRTRDGYLEWLGLASHELFHAWNVKRLRPAELDRLDYETEVYTRNLWLAEGFTSYYDDLLVHRAGLSTRDELLRSLGQTIEGVQTSPGRLVQPLEAASFDAWIKYYRRDENFANNAVSYYAKGAVVALLLDAQVRRATAGERSLDDAMRLAYSRYSGDAGFSREELRATLEEVAGVPLRAWLDRALTTAEELDYRPALDWYGLRFHDREHDREEEPPRPAGERPGWLGIEAEVQEGLLVVTQVRRGTPGFAAGLNVGDEVLAIGDHRVPPAGWKERLRAYRPGEETTLLVARRERLTRLPVVFGEVPRDCWKLEADPAATPEQRARLAAWLRGSGAGGEGEERRDGDGVAETGEESGAVRAPGASR